MKGSPKRGVMLREPAPNFALLDFNRDYLVLEESISLSPAMLIFFKRDFMKSCKERNCDYRNQLESFSDFGFQLFGISGHTTKQHAEFTQSYSFPYLLLSDPGGRVAGHYGCLDYLSLDSVSRVVFLISTQGMILYRYLEPVVNTQGDEHPLLSVMEGLQSMHLL